MPAANASDFFGEGTLTGGQKPTYADPNEAPNPNNPGGISNNELARRRLALGASGVGGGYSTGSGSGAITPNGGGNHYLGKALNVLGTGLRWAVDPYGSALAAYSGIPALQALTSPVGAITAVGTGQVPTNLNAVTGGGGGAQPAAAPVDTGPVVGGGDVPTGPDVTVPPPADTTTPPATPPETPAGGTPTGAAGDLLSGINAYQNEIHALAGDNTGLSVAEAQLKKAQLLANADAAAQTEASQRGALGMARSARNRGDRALLERQAVGEAGYMGQQAARDASLRRSLGEADLSILRATESQHDRQFKLDALKAAGELGLNTAALEIDLTKVNIQDATERMKVALGYANLDADKARDIMNFTRDMASIQFEYDQLGVTDQNEADKLLMQQYGIDQSTMIELKKIKEAGRFRWDQVLTSFIGGVGTGVSGAAGMAVMSDERVKTNIAEVKATADEFDEFMNAMTANTYEYKEPEKYGHGLRFGFMAQDLEKTKLGKHMVTPTPAGKMIEIGPLAAATASGLALVHERLKELEKAVRS